MPSGAKKRKAAKKKKEQETSSTNPSSTNDPQGDNNNELKSQDEKGSDGDDHQFNEGSDAQPSATADAVAKSMKEAPNDGKINEATEGGKEGGVVVIEWDLKSEESCESKDVSLVHIESAKESGFGSGNSNSGGSNDEMVAAKNSKDEPHNSVEETVAYDELVKSINSSHAGTTLVNQNAPVEETVNSVAESSTDSVKVATSVAETKSGDTGNALLEKSMGSSQVGASATDLVMKRNEDKVHPFSDEDVRTSSLEEPKQFDSKVSSPLSHNSLPESTNGAEHVKYSDTPECSENQPLVASAPHMVQKTSWLSCCGLFEVLLGSNR